ncbi:MAG: P1 family peptidase [Nocardioidaceae bacterium]
MDPLFEAVVEATEEAVLNSMFGAPDTVGVRGHLAPSLHSTTVLELLHR